jgi:hypothetical protein
MRKMTNLVVDRPKRGKQDLVRNISIFAAILAISCSLGFSGCSVKKDALSQSALKPHSTTQASTPTKSQISTPSSQTVQELIVREERGQTTLLIKFSQPITEYRHFTLPQPARVVLDILNYTKGSTLADVFRIDTGNVAALRLNASENNLRIVMEIAAATVPPYTIAPEN